MKTFTSIVLIALCNVMILGQSSTTTEARLGDMQEFALSPAAKALGIDGKMQIGLSISSEGKASGIRIYGGPMWPCGANPGDEIDNVRDAVKKYLLASKFVPATRNGRPISTDVQITFLLSDSFKNARDHKLIEENLAKGINPPLVDIPNISQRVVDIPRQLSALGNSISARLSEVQILVDEKGDVIAAGGFRIDPRFLSEARNLACRAKFKPLTINQKPVRMTGTLMFELY